MHISDTIPIHHSLPAILIELPRPSEQWSPRDMKLHERISAPS